MITGVCCPVRLALPIMTAQLVAKFIADVWNEGSMHLMDTYLHPDFINHSLPSELPSGAEGVREWIAWTSAAFEHHTIIEDQVTEGDKSMVRVTLQLKHIGTWRGIPATFRGSVSDALDTACFGAKRVKIISALGDDRWALPLRCSCCAKSHLKCPFPTPNLRIPSVDLLHESLYQTCWPYQIPRWNLYEIFIGEWDTVGTHPFCSRNHFPWTLFIHLAGRGCFLIWYSEIYEGGHPGRNGHFRQ